MLSLSHDDKCLVELGQFLLGVGYTFTTVTPATHERILQREPIGAGIGETTESLRDFFGWNKPVPLASLPSRVLNLCEAAGILKLAGSNAVSKLRFSTIENLLIMHSGFPTIEKDSVFFGPDSYRFIRHLKQTVNSGTKIIDVGAGTGVGGMCLARHLLKLTGRMPSLVLADINHLALRFCKINLAINGFENVQVIKSDILRSCPLGADVIISNPPFVIDESGRLYRDGGGNYGTALSTEIVRQAVDYLKGSGQLVVYTGACFVNGTDQFLKSIEPIMSDDDYDYVEIDPDIFGEQLSSSAYAEVERTAAVGLNYFRQLGQTP